MVSHETRWQLVKALDVARPIQSLFDGLHFTVEGRTNDVARPKDIRKATAAEQETVRGEGDRGGKRGHVAEVCRRSRKEAPVSGAR